MLGYPPTPAPIPFPSQSKRRFPKANLPPQKRLCLTTPTPRFEVGESSTAAATRQPGLGAGRTTDYGFVDIVADAPRRHVTMEVGYGITENRDELVDAIQEGALTTLEGDNRARLSDRVDILLEDRLFHQQIVMLMEDEALVSREAWAQAMGSSAAVHYELQAYRSHTQIQDLPASVAETFTATSLLRFHHSEPADSSDPVSIRALQARDQAHVDDPEDADSYSYFTFQHVAIYH
ncbi:hypothetical protein Tco_1506578 [Tanacetum coccineum]